MSAIFDNITCSTTSDLRSSPTVAFNRIGAEEFHGVVAEVVTISPFYKDNLSVKESYEGYDCWISNDGQAGFAVSPEQELVNVFSLAKGHGQCLMAFATQQYGALHLNCLAGNHLEKFYSAHGFVVAERQPNWNDGEPDVVFMRRSAINNTL